jgi:RND family efflux transporter MFP subunit
MAIIPILEGFNMKKVLLCLSALLLVSSCSLRKELPIKKASYIPVNVMNVKTSSIKRFTQLNGYIQPSEIVPIIIPPNGSVKKIYVKESDTVSKNDLLISLDTSLIDKKIKSLLTQEKQIDKYLTKKEQPKPEDPKSFFNFITQRTQSDKVINEFSKMNSNLLKSKKYEIKNAIEELKLIKEQSHIKAPINGLVTNIEARENSVAIPSAPSLFVANLDTIEGVFLANQFQVQNLKVGQTVEVTIDSVDDDKVLCEVLSVSTIPKTGTDMYEVKVKFNNNNVNLRGGMKASATVITKQIDDALTIPINAILYIKNEPYVYKIEKGKAIAQRISIGIRQNDKYQVLSGLNPNDLIIVNGKESVKDGDFVKIK